MLTEDYGTTGREFVVVTEGAGGKAFEVTVIVEDRSKAIIARVIWWTAEEPQTL